MKAMVLAAGKGTRLLPLTSEIPKPMAPIVGKPIIQHIFELLAEAGVEEVHINVFHLAKAILSCYGESSQVGGMSVNVSREERLMGTAGGVKRLADHFDDTFVVMMGDALSDVDVREVVAFHKERSGLATLALTPVSDTSQYGVVELDGEGNIRAFQEKPKPEEAVSSLANTGIYILEPQGSWAGAPRWSSPLALKGHSLFSLLRRANTHIRQLVLYRARSKKSRATSW